MVRHPVESVVPIETAPSVSPLYMFVSNDREFGFALMKSRIEISMLESFQGNPTKYIVT